MPSGSAPGERRGGRQKHTPNKSTYERERLRAAVLLAEGKRLGKEIMSDGANAVFAIAERYKPDLSKALYDKQVDRYVELMKIACAMAADVTPYESPRLQSTTIHNIPPDLSGLTDAELAELDRLSIKIIDAGSDRNGTPTTRH